MSKEEIFVGRGAETRTFPYFTVPTAPLSAFVPEAFQIAPLFDGTERVTAIVSVPVYARRIFLPGSG